MFYELAGSGTGLLNSYGARQNSRVRNNVGELGGKWISVVSDGGGVAEFRYFLRVSRL